MTDDEDDETSFAQVESFAVPPKSGVITDVMCCYNYYVVMLLMLTLCCQNLAAPIDLDPISFIHLAVQRLCPHGTGLCGRSLTVEKRRTHVKRHLLHSITPVQRELWNILLGRR